MNSRRFMCSPLSEDRHPTTSLQNWPPMAEMGHSRQRRLELVTDACPECPGDLNRSTQHLLILLDKEVADGDVTDIVHGEAEG